MAPAWSASRGPIRSASSCVAWFRNGFFGVSDWGLGEGWQALLGDRAADAVESEPHAFREDEPVLAPEQSNGQLPTLDGEEDGSWGERRYRWRGRGGLLHIRRDAQAA